MENVFQECLQEATKGRRIVQEYYSRHDDGAKRRAVVLIFPDDDPRLQAPVARYLDRFLHEFYYDLAIVLSSVDFGLDFQSLTTKPLYLYRLEQSDMDAVLRFRAFDIGQNGIYDIKLFSFRMPFHVQTEDLIGFKDVTADKLVFYSLFEMLSGEAQA